MKHLTSIYELYKTPNLKQNDIEEMIKYLEDYAERNGHDIYRQKPMDVSALLPDFKETRISGEDPYGEEEWEVEKPKLMSAAIMLFEDDSKNAKKILTFAWMTSGTKYSNSLYIGYSKFDNIDFNILKQLVEG